LYRRRIGIGHRLQVVAVRQTALFDREWVSQEKAGGVSLVGVAGPSGFGTADLLYNELRSVRDSAD
jgi:hypothetical protein